MTDHFIVLTAIHQGPVRVDLANTAGIAVQTLKTSQKKNQKLSQASQISQPPSQPTPPNPQPEAKPESTEHAPKMRKVMIGSTEFQVENGVTLTIAGIPVTIG